MHLKEEWEMAEQNLAKRKSLMLGHVSAALITIFIGICLLFISKYNFANKILTTVTSSITASGGILALITTLYNKASANKANITKFIEAMKSVEKAENIPGLINMDENYWKILKTERHENYIKFLSRINYLISSLDFHMPNLSHYLAGGIIACGGLWLVNIILTHMIEIYETVSNWHWKSAYYNKTMGFEEYRTENDDVTFFGAEIDAKLVLRVVLMLNELTKYPPIEDNLKMMQNNELSTQNFCNTGIEKVNTYLKENELEKGEKIILYRIVVILAEKFKEIIEKIIDDLDKEIVNLEYFKENPKCAKKLAKIISENIINIDTLIIMLAKELKPFSKQYKKTLVIKNIENNKINFHKCNFKSGEPEEFVITFPEIESRKRAIFSLGKNSDKIIEINMKFDDDKDNPATTHKITINPASKDAKSSKVIYMEKGDIKDIKFFESAMNIAKKITFNDDVKDIKDNEHGSNADINKPNAVSQKLEESKSNEIKGEDVNKELEELIRMVSDVKDGIDIFVNNFKTENDDEAMKLIIKIINKDYNFEENLTKHDKKSFSFRKIYRHNIKENFGDLFKKASFMWIGVQQTANYEEIT
ncbi:25864_t:CDS:2 [Gigaspora rosea]|nr:25864_t:CDS:2 [Gigaspora rosea]